MNNKIKKNLSDCVIAVDRFLGALDQSLKIELIKYLFE